MDWLIVTLIFVHIVLLLSVGIQTGRNRELSMELRETKRELSRIKRDANRLTTVCTFTADEVSRLTDRLEKKDRELKAADDLVWSKNREIIALKAQNGAKKNADV
jgi:predicted nuclease with TOPRIM domain